MKVELMSAEELKGALIERERRLTDAVYIDGEHLTIDLSYPYHIALSRLDSPAKILRWVHHLSGKRWMTRGALARFIDLAMAAIGEDVESMP